MTEQPAGARTDGVDRCPSCGARVVPDQDWCSLCLQPLRVPAPKPGPEPDVGPVPGPQGAPEREPEPSAGREADLRPEPGQLPPGVAEAMLAELAASTSEQRPLARGPLARASRGARLALGFGAALVLVAVLVGLLALVGLLL